MAHENTLLIFLLSSLFFSILIYSSLYIFKIELYMLNPFHSGDSSSSFAFFLYAEALMQSGGASQHLLLYHFDFICLVPLSFYYSKILTMYTYVFS